MRRLAAANSAQNLTAAAWLLVILGQLAAGFSAPVWCGSPLKNDDIELNEGEALLLVAIDSDRPIAGLTIRGRNGNFPLDVIRDIAGNRQQYFLYRVGPDVYDLSQLQPDVGANRDYLTIAPELADMPAESGVINYSGTLVLRFAPDGRGSLMHRPNRGLAALDWLSATFPRAAARYPLTYQGPAEDDTLRLFQEKITEDSSP